MWYHYIVALLAIYMLANSIYRTVKYGNHGAYDWTVFAVNMLVTLALGWWAWSGITAPSPIAQASAMMGGRRSRSWWR